MKGAIKDREDNILLLKVPPWLRYGSHQSLGRRCRTERAAKLASSTWT